ncbi:MAG TPA: AMP-binding protein [Rhizomicrobium sp.]|nr:AMP-binding protein [Rhizomicrobium sp.]
MRAPFEPFPHVVSKHARDRATHDAIIFLERGEAETERLSYGALETVAASRAAGLAARGLGGRPVAIAMRPGAAFVGVFLGCLKAGAIAVPVPLADSVRGAERLRAILADARPDAIVADHAARLEAIAGGAALVAAGELEGACTEFQAPDADDPALIQYTSGSTSAPKGIVITHGNLAANQEMIRSAFAMDEHCIGVNWLPHFHDMGLMGAILQPLFVGGTAVLMPPRAFVQKPLRWLRAIEKYAATCAGGPCFGYDLCVRTIAPEQAAALDLSSWKTAFCGAEPIRAPVLAAFAQRFAAARFRREAFLPCYGLAEATLIASCTKRGQGVREKTPQGAARAFVSCGTAVEDSAIMLREETHEICVAGPHVSPGIWDGARRAVTPFPGLFAEDGKTWLATGDIGAFADGELLVVDRLGDFMILYGAKVHAADIEATVLDDPDLRAAAAFAADDGTRERLVVLCETDRRTLAALDRSAAGERLSRRVAEAHGVVPTIGFVAYGELPRTSSGKIQRFASRTKFLSGELGVPKVAAPMQNTDPHADRST